MIKINNFKNNMLKAEHVEKKFEPFWDNAENNVNTLRIYFWFLCILKIFRKNKGLKIEL
jgi:hypothetical protein